MDMHFWRNRIHCAWDLIEVDIVLEDTLVELREDKPVAAVLCAEGFDDWSGLGSFLSESNTKLGVLVCEGQGAFKDKGFLKAAASKLELWMLARIRLGREETESLRAAYAAGFNNPSALALWHCNWDPEAMPEFVSHLKRLEIRYGGCDWTQLGKALKLPNSRVEDLSLKEIPDTLDWLADAVQSEHCKLRRLALSGSFARNPERLVQVLQSRLEGLEIDYYGAGEAPYEEVLIEALKASSSLWFLQIRGFVSPRLGREGILGAHKLSHLVLFTEIIGNRSSNQMISELLGSPHCRLRSFIIVDEYDEPNPRQLQEFQEHVLNILEGNYQSQLQELDLLSWTSKSLELRCSYVLYRNSLSKNYIGKFVRPGRVFKLFMCGHTRVGKTTIATNLLRSSAIPVPAFLQRHASTQGITLRNLEIGGGKTLVIFDLAGQEGYHAFHHYFIRRTENNLFLIVCKVDKGKRAEDPEQYLKRLLTYWLRFIVSHQSAQAETRPRVLVVLNHFCKGAELEYDALQAAKEVLERFSMKVSLMEPAVLEVVALRPKQVSKLKGSLERVAEDAAQHLPLVPEICSTLTEKKARKWYKMGHQQLALGEKTILKLEEVAKLLPESEDRQKQNNALKFALICLHNMGDAIYFGSTQDTCEEGTILADHVILDVQWFVRDIIGKFIPELPGNDDGCPGEGAIISTNPLHTNLRRLLAPDQEDPDQKNRVLIIVKYLEEMGVIIPHWREHDKVIIPTLLKNKFTGCNERNETRYRYWGRRMQPPEEDREFTLLPSGVFSMIQAELAKLCKSWNIQQSLDLGDGWISFTKNAMKVLVLVGGENEKWTDRQWVDIMLMVPEDNIRCAEAERILGCVRDCIFNLRRACPFLKIKEHALNPKQVKDILHGAPNTGVQAILLDHLIDMAKAHGLDFHHSWDTDTDNESCYGELLLLSELKQLVQSRQSVVDDFNSIAPVYELKRSSKAMPEFENKDIKNQTEYLEGILQGHFQQLEGHFQQLKVSMGAVLDTLHRMEHNLRMNQEQILSGISQMLQHIQVPKFPYFTDEKNFFLKYSNPTGERVWIHYMCESAKKHPMDHNKYEGVPMVIAHDWIKKYMYVLVPAITVSFFFAKLGSTFTGTGITDVLNVVENGLQSSLAAAFQGNLEANINSCFGESVYIRQPAQHEVEEVLDHVKKAAGEQNLTVLMAKYFGLYFHGGAWVCDKHRL